MDILDFQSIASFNGKSYEDTLYVSCNLLALAESRRAWGKLNRTRRQRIFYLKNVLYINSCHPKGLNEVKMERIHSKTTRTFP